MATGTHHGSATIYTFPGGRFTSARLRQKAELEKDIVHSVYDSCWYHEEAMKEADAPAKPKFAPRIVD